MIKFRLPGMSFTADLQNLHSEHYPYFNGQSGNFTSLVFDQAFGIYEVPDADGGEDGIIDDLGPDSEFAEVFPAVVESLIEQPIYPVFFARSTSPLEDESFGLQRGSNFPALPEEFFRTEEGATLEGEKTLADVVLFAGTISVRNCETEILKTDRDEVEICTPSTNLFRPIFVQIDLRSVDITPAQYLLSDVHAGNLRQGLVMSTFSNHESPVPQGVGSFDVSVDASEPIYTTSGNLKDALTGAEVVTEDGTPYSPAQARVSADWMNIPIYPDNDIAGLKETFVVFGGDE